VSNDTIQWLLVGLAGITLAVALIRPIGKHLARAQLALGAGMGLLGGHQLFGAGETLLVFVCVLLVISIASFVLSLKNREFQAARKKP
jgi:uncharacterized membrane protein